MSTLGAPSARNGVGIANMAMYMIGITCFAVCAYLASITRINLLTGKSTHPDLTTGIIVAVVGVTLAGIGRIAAKRRLNR